MSYFFHAVRRKVETKTVGDSAGSTLTTVYRYDSIGNLLKQATQGPMDISFDYSYNKNNCITGEKRVEGEKIITNTYDYDALGQLTAFASSTGYGENYAYDPVDNMLKKVITPAYNGNEAAVAVTLKMSCNKGNQLVSIANGKDRLTYAYDAKEWNRMIKEMNAAELSIRKMERLTGMNHGIGWHIQ